MKPDWVRVFKEIAAVMEAHVDELCEMDARLGDGDLGLTMKKGFSAMPEIYASIAEEDTGKRLMKAGMKMAGGVPSTMGTLMASGIMDGGKAISGKDEMDAQTLLLFLEGFSRGIAKRGKCERGDCTVLDSVSAAADAVRALLAKDAAASLETAAVAARSGAREGAEATRNMTPKYGKAAVHREAAAGEIDQGAYAGSLLVEGLCNGLLQ